MKWLLDTNTCVEFLRNRNSGVNRRIRAVRPGELRLCSIVVAELAYGAWKSADPPRNLGLLNQLVTTIESLPFDDDAGRVYGRIRKDLNAKGTPIGPNDLMIAAIAVNQGLTLVTNNQSEFSRVADLTLENWMADT